MCVEGSVQLCVPMSLCVCVLPPRCRWAGPAEPKERLAIRDCLEDVPEVWQSSKAAINHADMRTHTDTHKEECVWMVGGG